MSAEKEVPAAWGKTRLSITIRRLDNRLAALGAALRLVAQRPPFATFPAAALARTLQGQIDRGHYLLGLDGQKLGAYLGWAMLSAGVAERLLRYGDAPHESECASGDILWLLTVAAADTAVLRAALAAGRRLHPGGRVVAVRRRADGRGHLFDRRLPLSAVPLARLGHPP
jgi:hemolysin-activating ACP:hemolysin acyltransferase